MEIKRCAFTHRIWARDLENNQVVVKMRDLEDKATVSLDELKNTSRKELDTMQTRLYESAC